MNRKKINIKTIKKIKKLFNKILSIFFFFFLNDILYIISKKKYTHFFYSINNR